MILVTGATGFVGSHLVRGLSRAGHDVRALARTEASAAAIKDHVAEVAVGDIGDPDAIARATDGCDTVIHLVGIIQPGPGYSFRSVHVEGTRNVLDAAKGAGTVRHFIYQSAQGTRADAVSDYHKTKFEAEEMTKASGLDYTITRPSIIIGRGDGFTTKLAGIIRLAPLVPVLGGGKGKLQPVYIDDLVEVFVRVVGNPAFFGRTVGVCGPEQHSFNEMMDMLKDALGVKRPTIHIPLCMVWPAAALMESVLTIPPVTRDQLTMLQEDNICESSILKELGIKATGFRDGLRRFLG